jgi:hypothetical protein
MSMIGRLRHVPPEELERLQRRPSDMRTFLHGKKNSGRRIEDILALFQKLEVTKQEVLGRGATSGSPEHLAFMTHVQKELEAAGFGNGVGPGLSLDKSWHVLHFLLTGQIDEAPAPLGLAILGGTEIGSDVGHGPARYLTPGQVADVATALSATTITDLERRFESVAAHSKDLYACRDQMDAALAAEALPRLRHYYDEAVRLGHAMILWID